MSAGLVFISHGSENRSEAEEIVSFIEGHGLKTWIAPRDVRPGMDYSEQLQSAIEQCLAFVVLVSETANTSPYVRAETEMAFSNNKPIFPVRRSEIMPAAGLAFFLKIRHWTDDYGADAEASMARLALELRTLAGLSGEATPSAPAPAASPPAVAASTPASLITVSAAKPGLPKSTLYAMLAAGVLVLIVAIVLAIGQNRADPVPPPSPGPSPMPSPEPSPEPAPTPAPAAAIDRGLLVGRWSSDGNCANALEFTDDGRVLTADGVAAGIWVLTGDVLAVTTANGEQHSARINSVDQSAIYSTDNDGSVEVSQRC